MDNAVQIRALKKKVKLAADTIESLCLQHSAIICPGKVLGECQREGCWIFNILKELRAA